MDALVMDTLVKDVPSDSAMKGMLDVAAAALTDSMVERLATTTATGLEILDRANDPDTRAALHRVIDGLTTMHTTGSLDTIFEAAQVIEAARAAMTDEMIERLYHTVEVMANNLATPEIAELARNTEMSFYEAARRCDGDKGPKSMVGLVRLLLKPETMQTLNLLVAFGDAMRQRMEPKSKIQLDVCESTKCCSLRLDMPDDLGIKPGLDEAAVVERVVPGKLVYVTADHEGSANTYSFKLDQLVLRKADGSCRPYRGEPLSELGVAHGRKVIVWGINHTNVSPTLVIDTDRPKEFIISLNPIAGTISMTANAVVKTINKVF